MLWGSPINGQASVGGFSKIYGINYQEILTPKKKKEHYKSVALNWGEL